MPLNILKLCVGSDSIEDLEEWIESCLDQRRRNGELLEHWHTTRMVPTRGAEIVDGGSLAYYVPNPYDTIHQVSRRFGLTETQLVWLNPELFMYSAEPQLTSGIGVNLDPARR